MYVHIIPDEHKRTIWGTGSENALTFALDFGSSFFLDGIFPEEKVLPAKKYTIMVTPPDHYSIGQLAEERNTVFEHDTGKAVLNYLDWNLQVDLDYIAGTTEEFRALDPHKRNCLFADEVELRMFPTYSEANCFLECAWEHAADICECAPWFLLDKFPATAMCELYGNRCFRNIIDHRFDGDIPCQYECLPDCEKVHYVVVKDDPKSDGQTTQR